MAADEQLLLCTVCCSEQNSSGDLQNVYAINPFSLSQHGINSIKLNFGVFFGGLKV